LFTVNPSFFRSRMTRGAPFGSMCVQLYLPPDCLEHTHDHDGFGQFAL